MFKKEKTVLFWKTLIFGEETFFWHSWLLGGKDEKQKPNLEYYKLSKHKH